MTMLQLYSGKKFDFTNFGPSDFEITDIAHALSNICRFGGQVSRFYSVAQHCVLMAWSYSGRRGIRTALLHDAAEAYIGDMVRHLKHSMPEFQRLENQLMLAIADRFGIDWPLPESLKQLDNDMLQAEFEQVWTVPGFADRPVYGEALPIKIVELWSPTRAEQEFIRAFNACYRQAFYV